ncbi:anosmin-1 Kallmann syndrome 1 isoform X1 [Megachile rotundata]|uniref:anosmin-1 Kallmann syndrome 1 isoform X1 n=1 Tax=Megachile rotundata TaxID=143995 RepID=UPI003FD4A9FB
MGGSRVVETNGVGRRSRRSAREAREESKPDLSSNGSPAIASSPVLVASLRGSIAHEDPSATLSGPTSRPSPVGYGYFRPFRPLLTHGSPSPPPMAAAKGSCYTVKSPSPPELTVTLKKWWLWWLLLPGCLASWTKYIEEYDSIRVARCDAYCGSNYSEKGYLAMFQCMENCLASNYTKPGHCPDKASMSLFEAVCLAACSDDSRCPDLAKCCRHDCGVTCMHPLGLDNRSDLPPIPDNLQIRQQKNNLIVLTWHPKGKYSNASRPNNNVRYLVEERHLLGPRYQESRLSSWAVRHVSTKSHATLRERLKTGHWYQFRIAAINENGSRGYSSPSRPFKTREPRNPKEPQNLTLSDARLVGGRLRITLRWVKPASDVPITFYKVFWSRLVHGPTNDSILVYHRTVLKDKTCYELKNLELKCQYFLQVQAVALYGNRRLASRKASKVFNSTDYMAYANVGRRSRRCERYQAGLHLRRMICHCGEVKVRLVWPTNHDVKAYNVSWREEACPSQDKHAAHRKKILWKVVQTPHLDIWRLRNGCTYNVNVRNIFHDDSSEKHGGSIEFVATGCQKEYDHKEKKLSNDKIAQCKSKSLRSKRYYSGLSLI